jgi:predicted DNA-binding transcriptional regulator AlpA
MRPNAPSTSILPTEGYVRLPLILSVFPVSRATWWAGVRSGRYPTPVKLGPRTTAWRAEDVRKLMEHPLGFGGRHATPVELTSKPPLGK